MKKTRSLAQRILAEADFPGEILTGVPVVELKGTGEAVVISHRGVIGYEPEEVKIASALGPIRIRGKDLTIFRMNRDRIVIHGTITVVEMEERPC